MDLERGDVELRPHNVPLAKIDGRIRNVGNIDLGLPAQASAAGGGVVDPSVVVASLNCLAKGTNCSTFVPSLMWPTIRGAMTWSINWDASNNFNFANTVKAGLNNLP